MATKDDWALDAYIPRRGRPRVIVRRTNEEFPAPTPQRALCRLWQGAVDKDGYGVLSDSPTRNSKGPDSGWSPHRKMYAHRWVYEAVHGPIPKGLVVRHKCDNRLCFRLSHLELGTAADNSRDAAERGRAGPILVLPPSRIAVLFDYREAGWTYAQIHEAFPEVSLATVKRIGRLGREEFNDLWGLPRPERPRPPGEKYSEWRARKPS